MNTFLEFINNLEPLFLTITSIGVAILSLSVYRSDRKSATNIIFILLSLSILFWMLSGYMAGIDALAEYTIIYHRLAIVFAAPMSTLFFLLALNIPNQKLLLSKNKLWFVIILTLIMMSVNISPYAFIGIDDSVSRSPIPGPGLLPFGIVSSVFSLLAVYYLFKKYFLSTGEEKKQIKIVLAGILVMLLLVIGTILVPIVVFKSGALRPLLSIYTLVFIGMTGYAITKYKLFNISVILTQAVTIVIWVVLLAKLFIPDNPTRIIDALIFLTTLLFGISLIRSVRREIEQRIKIQKLAEDLEAANEQQENLIHFISHEVKGYLTNAQAAFAGIIEGDFGPTSKELAEIVKGALMSTRKGSDTVKEILSASNFKSGKVTYKFSPFDLRYSVLSVVAELKATAAAKGLKLETNIEESPFEYNGDKDQIEQHVIRNLIDNSIKYTLQGVVTVGLENKNGKKLFSVKDTGIGITSEDKSKLFTQGGRGKESIKVNVNSTGYGLYIAKNIVDAHHGRIWAESEGAGKGSQFYVEF